MTKKTAPKKQERHRSQRQPPYHVILLNDNDHSFTYVIRMMSELFGYPQEQGYRIAAQVHTGGRSIVMTTHRELAELKQEQIHAFGRDSLLPRCKGSMSAVVEPAT